MLKQIVSHIFTFFTSYKEDEVKLLKKVNKYIQKKYHTHKPYGFPSNSELTVKLNAHNEVLADFKMEKVNSKLEASKNISTCKDNLNTCLFLTVPEHMFNPKS